ncbi:MAG: hypothetical protein Unbinned5081contig1002_28 [Prokaryotic dsDNA virus sp.]|nr:MAG: hypothetical protein Unbinned5081contig1002_28 [Prokaryotic dsDNA virus sp.]|tara:strand:- start:33951 stop:34721 length:771 start_codon:yes stop_codon:yes gene_type:complete
MTLSLEKRKPLPPRILIYGEPKKGKSTFGYQAPNPVFIQTEDGLEAMPDANAFPVAKTWEEVIKYMAELYNEDHDFNTLVVDSLDWLETLIHNKICQEKHVKAIADIPYGAGYNAALAYWREYISMINQLREHKNMMIVQIAHSQIADYKSPDAEAYSKHCIKMHKSASAYIKERSDVIIFVNTLLATKSEDNFGSKRRIALGGDERVLYTHDKNNNESGTRYHNMPQEIPFDKEGKYWSAIFDAIPFFNQTKKEG